MSRRLDLMTAKDNVVKAALRLISADHYERDGDPHADAEAEHAAELLALAARELARAVDKLPEHEQPIGWAAEGDTLPQWLYVRFGQGALGWHELTPATQSYWAHEAASVCRAVARGGFKTPPADGPSTDDMHEDDMRAERDCDDRADADPDEA